MRKYSTQDLWIRVILFFAICVILIFSFQGFVLRIVETLFFGGRRLIKENPPLAINIVRVMNGIVGIVLVFIFLLFDRQKMSAAGFSWQKKFGLEWIILSIPITIAGFIPTIIIERFVPEMLGKEPIAVIGGLLDPFGILVSLFIAFFAFGIGEELLFRGYLQTILETRYSFIFAAIVSATLFGLLHLLLLAPGGDITDMIAILFSAFAMGLTFSYVYKITNYNLIFPVAIHGFWDFFYFALQADTTYKTFIETIIGISASIIGAVVILFLVYLYSTIRLANNKVDNDNPPE